MLDVSFNLLIKNTTKDVRFCKTAHVQVLGHVGREFPSKLLDLLDEHQKNATPPRYPSVIQGAVLVDKTLLDEYEDGDEYVYSPN